MMTSHRRRMFQFLGFALLLSSCHLWRTTAFVSYPAVHHASKIHLSLQSSSSPLSSTVTSEEVRSRLVRQLEKLREKDRHAKVLTGENLKVVYEEKYLVVVDKPSGVLCVPSEQGIPSFAQTVFETVNHNLSSYDRMVVHRLGMETSGLVIFVKTMEALRGMNTLFRTRQVTRQYEVLVCGHVVDEEGTIDMPLMRDYVFPPYMRVSTDEHQQALIDLDPSIVGKKLLEAPKLSQTKYEVVSREFLLDTDLPVTRLTLTSITGRTHQLNVHCAAFGHPIVGDRVYGLDGEAAPNGGLVDTEREGNGATSIEMQREIAKVASDMDMCVHAKCLQFRHPVTGKALSFESTPPF